MNAAFVVNRINLDSREGRDDFAVHVPATSRHGTLCGAVALAVALLTLGASLGAAAQTYPNRPIKLIVPFPPGGNVDLSARIVAPELGLELGQTIVIENKSGASGTLGLDAVAKASPDGYTLGIASPANHLVAPSLYPNLPYDSVRDFAPVGLVAAVPLVLAVGPSVSAKSVAELVNAARARATPLTMASSGNGTGNHIVGEQFQDAARVKFSHVPYKGSGPANADLVGGHVDLHFDQITSMLSLIQGGKVRALAVTSAKRSSQLPDVPTLTEAGIANFDASTTLGLVFPARTPVEVVQRMSSALLAVLKKVSVREQFARLGADVRETTPMEYADYIRTEIARNAKTVREAKIKLD